MARASLIGDLIPVEITAAIRTACRHPRLPGDHPEEQAA